ncbi:2-C-methyl-D-erythritol 4-phosphate cytidylyltransferase [Sulfuriflexus sp.]|uniref:2-C-methyl-D-erythritol 4-phosphate cytidylyltransferase n=1 Tax=Sulfuriflexus sp. TaxID=2015443 RepID=UPI0028CE4410|nr:2-C-methyl-D-erythritol 4-phosphate cytidylyltransferase [Sulfuriflexus sp.]MDT8402964.1 2-C-methyl-D-erythritol 4-phosphate cytidylyltransferase [Sulfuriflexus sp.]
MTITEQTFWVVIPAAGIGSRMQADCPKQYLDLQGKTVLEQTLAHFLHHPRIHGIVVAVAEHDTTWPTLYIDTDKPLHTVIGGSERCHSVLNALNFLEDKTRNTDWVLVHDAARPCLRRGDLDKLMITMAQHPQGGILAVPVRDTLKRVDVACIIEETVDRVSLWHALTPQMFHVGMLREALEKAIADGVLVTDEASAMEYAGYNPLVVEGYADNIKITRPEDLALARFHLATISDEAASDYDGLMADDG